jgi:hypothetical protein
MSYGEIRVIFRIVDKDRNNKIDGMEWHNFYNIFVDHF